MVGDLHLCTSEKYGKFDKESTFNTRTLDKLKILDFIVEQSLSAKSKAVFFLGDVFEHINPSEKLKSAFIDTIMPLIENKVGVFILLGNHDSSVHTHSYLTLKSLKHNFLHIIDSIWELNIEGKEVILVPYGYEEKLVSKLNVNRYDLLLGHINIKPYYNTGIEASFLSDKVKMVRCGHLHIPNEHYIGPPCIYNIGDIKNKQKFEILELPSMVLSTIYTPERPFCRVEVNLSNISSLTESLKDQPENSVILIRISDTKENLDSISIRSIKSTLNHFFKVIVEKNVLTDESVTIKVNNKETLPVTDEIKKYAKNIELEKIGLEIYAKAVQTCSK